MRWLTLASVLETLAVTVVAVHLVAYLRDTGLSAAAAALAAGALGVLSVAGRIALTALAANAGRVAAPAAAGALITTAGYGPVLLGQGLRSGRGRAARASGSDRRRLPDRPRAHPHGPLRATRTLSGAGRR